MSDAADPNEPEASDPALDRAERRVVQLGELADLALELARAEQRRALELLANEPSACEPAGRPAGGDPAAAFARAARVVRLTVALQARLEEDLAGCRREAEARARARGGRQSDATRADRIHADLQREVIGDYVGEVIEGQARGRRALLLRAELDDRLEREDERLLDRPLGAIIAEICRELGVVPDWSLWADEAWAVEETRTRAPGSPYAAAPWADPRDLPAHVPDPAFADAGPGP